MTDKAASGGKTFAQGSLTPPQVRLLKVAVIAMAVIIVLALVAIMARLFYLASSRSSPGSGLAASALESKISLPTGAVIRHISVSGDRLAIHYDAPGGAGIAIVDLVSGGTTARIAIVPEVPR